MEGQNLVHTMPRSMPKCPPNLVSLGQKVEEISVQKWCHRIGFFLSWHHTEERCKSLKVFLIQLLAFE